MTFKQLSAVMPADLKAIFEHMRRQRDCFEATYHARSIGFRCKFCGQRWRMRIGPSGVQPGPIDQMIAHADKHLFGHSMASH